MTNRQFFRGLIYRLFGRRNGYIAPVIKRDAGMRRQFRPIFICGVHRTGKTTLEKWLKVHCDISTLQAPVHDNEGQHLQDVYPQAWRLGGPGLYALGKEALQPLPDSVTAVRLANDLRACWSPWISGVSEDFVEKSPPNILMIPWLKELFPDARFILLTRDPRAVAVATRPKSSASLEKMLMNWHAAYAAALAASTPNDVIVSYEGMCESPLETVRLVADTLGLRLRSVPLACEDLPDLVNDNARLIAEFTAAINFDGAWTRLGYDLKS